MRNAAYTLIASVLLAAPLLLSAAGAVGADLPSWLTSEDARYLTGGYEQVDVAGQLSLSGFESKRLQSTLEASLENNIPCKASAMLGFASLQREAIGAANLPFGWGCYQSFFGSDRLYVPAYDALSYMPQKKSKSLVKQYKKFSKGLKACAARHQDVSFNVVIPQMSSDVPANPAGSLASSFMTAEDAVAVMHEVLGSQENVDIVSIGYDDPGSYYENYFRTDHHWNAVGTARAFNAVAEKRGLAKVDESDVIDFEGKRYTGSLGRAGLCDVSEPEFDVSLDMGPVEIEKGGQKAPYDSYAFFSSDPLEQRYLFYDRYLDIGANVEVSNAAGAGSALLIGDSFEGSFGRLLAVSYKDLCVSRQFHISKDISGLDESSRFEDLFGGGHYEDVFIVADLSNLANVMSVSPNYFSANDEV